ncbi:right-handed parallel beta-helix repeat-containing protein [Isoptericola sp. BMS4]|uniref:right-handed parallel beta-helix repeat-containing protein n=1 Tax=Isoptericola sp. BMS4 TaxID=2527875 RepID=UPI00142226BB|nr:right-handed parallel beta-helix repeat-containing protein [Isoptericola sp. BMS4]
MTLATGATTPLVLPAGPDEPLADAADRLSAALAEHPGRDVEVRLAPGTYRLAEPLRLGPEHSGDATRTVTWSGPGAVLSGGVPLTWRPGDDGRWLATVPDGVTPTDLFVGGRRSPRARSAPQPADVSRAVSHGITGARAFGIDRWSRPDAVTCVVKVRWRAFHLPVTGVEGDVMTFPEPCWTNVTSGTGRVGPYWDTTAVDGRQFAGGIVLENAIELLVTPGDHVWDPENRTITYLPRPGERPDADAVVPATERLLVLDGAHHVRLDGLTISHSGYAQPATTEGYAGAQAGLTLTGATGPQEMAGRYYTKPSAALLVRGGAHVVVADCTFTRLAGAGAILEHGTSDTVLTRSRFEDVGSGAVYVGDTEPRPGPDRASVRNTVSRCVVRRAGARYTDAVGIWAGYVAELTLDHNTLDDLPYSGISVGWGWNQPEVRDSVLRDNRVTANRITRVMRVATGMHDGGAIYTQGAQPGTVIARNHLDRSGYGGTQRDGNGIYLDEQSSHLRVEENVVTRVGYKWLSNWAAYGIGNRSRGNWTDTDAPALGGEGSGSDGDHVRLDLLPPEALAVAADAGADVPDEWHDDVPGAVWAGALDLARAGTADQSSVAATVARTTEDLSRLAEGQSDGAVVARSTAHAAAVALDRDTGTDTATADEPGSWWRVDLGADRHVGSVELWNAQSMVTRDVVVEVADAAGEVAASVRVDGLVRRPTHVDVGATGRTVTVRRAGGGVELASVAVHAHPTDPTE